MSETNAEPEATKLKLEIQNLRHQNKRLQFELTDLRHENPKLRAIRRHLPVLSWLVSLVAIPATIFAYFIDRKETREASLLEIKRETSRPFWDKQIPLYLEAAEKTAFIAVSTNEQKRQEAVERFWVLYWGPLAAVEDAGLTRQRSIKVEMAMYEFGELLKSKEPVSSEALSDQAFIVSRAIRDAIGPAFNLEADDLR